MSQDLNPVKPTVSLGGEEIVFESLVLKQGMNSCHHFDVVREFMSQDEMWKESPQKLLGYVGSQVIIKFSHMDSKHPYEFSGWVTDVRVDAWESEPDYDYVNHKSNRVHIIGEGDIIQLNGSRGMDSFVDCQLKSIVTQSVSKFGIGLDCNPKFDGSIPYVMRYHETVFEFLNRLSSTYNELFFYDGKKISFGTPGNCGEENLVFEQDVYSLRTHASAFPRKISAYDYFVENDKGECTNAQKGSASGLLNSFVSNADRLFNDNDKELLPGASPVTDNGYLQKMLDAKSKARDGSMLTVEGETRTCRVKIGCIVDISFPSSMGVSSLGRYRVIEIVHKVDKNGNYSNHFVASPENMEYVTQQYLDVVKAYPEVAYVKSNADPKSLGRVQIQFEWQKRMGKESNWIRVQSPDAGGSGMKNRGMVFVPEEGDQVMVGFEFGDPNRPYVMGSMFGGKSGNGGGDSNNVHSIVTKSGRQIIMDDSNDGGITISDANGNFVVISTSGGIVEIGSTKEISLHSKVIKISADEDIIVKAGKNYDKKIDGNSSISIKGDAKEEIKGKLTETVEGDSKISIKGKKNETIEKDFTQEVSGKMNMKVSKDCKAEISGKLTCEVSKDGKINSKSKLYVTGGGNVYVGK
ncbi:MAG: type IV secretion protein Rhs [Paludibacteraceae bacterium]|nr:type IV secretion protein Rhs [Paludibacteraceae bacterium]